MSVLTEDDRRAAAADIAHRRRALRINASIFARRHAPDLLRLLADGGGTKARCIGRLAWLAAKREWLPEDTRRIAGFADAIAWLGRLRPDIAEACRRHADRLRELVRQHAAVPRLEAERRPRLAWPMARGLSAARTRRQAHERANATGPRG